MAFGQPPGPPASARQVQELLALLQDAGHVDFRDARGPMGFNQRQAGGRFTRDEADGYIHRLRGDESGPGDAVGVDAAAERVPHRLLSRMPAEQLAAELRRRGWMAIEPLGL